MDYNHLAAGFSHYLPASQSTRRRSQFIFLLLVGITVFIVWYCSHLCLLSMLQVNYSQCLGVIGYSLIPLVLTATALPLVNYFPMISVLIKVRVA